MKKTLILSVVCAMALSLTGCKSHEHTWKDATCLEPKTCTECGQTEGEAAGHRWEDASCEEAKRCKVCGQTEGEPLGHTWVEASYTAPQTCSVCGKTEGEPLPEPYAEKNGLTFRKLENMSLPFAVTYMRDGAPVEINGLSIEHGDANFTFGEITRKPSAQAGYVDVAIPIRVTMTITFVDDISKYNGGFDWNISFPGFETGDYYTGLMVPTRALSTSESETSDATTASRDYTWDGNSYTISFTDAANSGSKDSGWKHSGGNIYRLTYDLTHDQVYTVTVPENFDGAVLRLERATTEVNLNAETDSDACLVDEHGADYYFYYRLSDLVN